MFENDDYSQIAENLILNLTKLPLVKIDREKFLRKELSTYFKGDLIEEAILTSPKQAQIPRDIIDKIADGCIFNETTQATLTSVAAGLPGGWAMAGTIPADMMQLYAHVLRVAQKLVYLYGWADIFSDGTDEGTTALLMVLLAVALSVNGATSILSAIAKSTSNQLPKTIAKTALTKTAWYPLLKKMSGYVGVKLTKDTFAKSLSKVIPVIGGLTSGGVTLLSFIPMANRLKKHLREFY